MFGGFDGFYASLYMHKIFTFLIFGLVFIVIIVRLFQGLKEWNKNNHSPQLTVNAIVVGKRDHVSRRRSGTSNMHHTSTSYYITFEVESGDRMEFHVSGSEFGQLIEGDAGKLTFQGTRYLGFERMR